MARYIRKKKQSTVAAWHLMGNSHSYFSIPLLPVLVILILPYRVAIADEVYFYMGFCWDTMITIK